MIGEQSCYVRRGTYGAFYNCPAHIYVYSGSYGETWCIGDQPTIGVLLEDKERQNYTLRPAPRVRPDCTYEALPGARNIRVYHTTDVRLTLEDFYAKLALHFGN